LVLSLQKVEAIVGWASKYIEALQRGEFVKFRPRGNSMSGKVESGQLVTVGPVGSHKLIAGDIVLCKVNGIQYLHLVKAIAGDRVQIGNNKGRINGWTARRNVFGVVTEISS
jgi:hypothetical protein